MLERNLFVKYCESTTRVKLQIQFPKHDEKTNDWICCWRCDVIKPNFFPIHAEDEIAVYYYTLNFITDYIVEIKKFGYDVWQNEIGDNGGFLWPFSS